METRQRFAILLRLVTETYTYTEAAYKRVTPQWHGSELPESGSRANLVASKEEEAGRQHNITYNYQPTLTV